MPQGRSATRPSSSSQPSRTYNGKVRMALKFTIGFPLEAFTPGAANWATRHAKRADFHLTFLCARRSDKSSTGRLLSLISMCAQKMVRDLIAHPCSSCAQRRVFPEQIDHERRQRERLARPPIRSSYHPASIWTAISPMLASH
jgi:hypothetical protein